MTELHRSTVDASGASVTAGYVPLADGAGLVTWGSVSIPAGTYVLTTEGGQETIKAHGATGATEAIDPTDGNIHTMTLDSNCTATIAAPTGSGGSVMEWWVTQDGTGGRVLTIAATGGTVTNTTTPDTTASVVVRYVLERLPATSNDWIVNLVGGSSFATPAIVLGTAAAAGSAATVIRSDSTIVAFDATVPVTQAFGDVAATGSAAVASRRDHVHGMPAAPTSGATDHEFIGNVTYSGDASTTAFELPAAPFDAYSVMAYVAGVRTAVTLSGALLTTMTFGSAPGSGTDNIIVDIVAAAA